MTGRYEVLSKIAAGGMATVFAGRLHGANGFSKLVAIKCPHPYVLSDPDLAIQFEREAKLASQIHHPNVVSILDVAEINGSQALILEFVEGCTFSALLKGLDEVPNRDSIILRVLLDACAGLQGVHTARGSDGVPLNIVHRDISPHNILVGLDGIARISDFGIAKGDSSGDKTATAVLRGKIGYMAPEYLESHRFDVRSDLFSLAVVGWQALAKRKLFSGGTEVETLRMALESRVPKLSEVLSHLEPFDSTFARALARDPADRFESVAVFAQALEAVARDRDLLATSTAVGACVDAVARKSLHRVRASLGSSAAEVAEEPSVGRDFVATQSLVIDAPKMVGLATSAPPQEVREPSSGGPPLGVRRPRTWIVFTAGGVLLLGTAVATMALMGRRNGAGMNGTAASETSSSFAPLESASRAALPMEDSATPTSAASAAPTSSPHTSAAPTPARESPRTRPTIRIPVPTKRLIPKKAPPNPYE
nr:serine/threonine protein kinase [Polyangiaceae bacterium]